MESVVFLKTNEPFGGLSNMAGGYPIHVNGLRILTSEALYQVCRFPHLPDVQKIIIGQISPMTAKMRSKPYRKDSRPDWDQVRVRIMRWTLRMKLANNWNTFSELLLRTGERPIVEESRKDDFWGAKATDNSETLVGMNVLGRLLMELREQVKHQGRDAALDVAPPDIPQFLLLGRPIDVGSGSPPQAAAEQEQGALFGTDATVIVEATAPPDALAASPSYKAAYEAYRPARMRWLPPVPNYWDEQRAKVFFREVDERSRTGGEELLSVSHLTGVTPRSQKNITMFKSASYVGSKLCRPGDIVINTLWAWMAALGASRHAGIVSPAYGVYRSHRTDSFNPTYLDYLLRTRAYVTEYIGRSTGIRSSRLRLYPNQFLDIALIQPPRTEQDQMVVYLRVQDAHIARFIKAKRELIKLLTEHKQRIVASYLTGRSFHSEPLKDSGNLWLGHVPASWVVCRVKAQLLINEGGCWGDDPVGNSGTAVLRSTEQAMDGSWKVSKPAIRLLSHKEAEAKSLKCGDLVITKSSGSERHIGKTSLVNKEIEALGCCFSNFMQRLRPKSTVSSKWIWFLLNSRLGRDQMAYGSNSTTGLGNLTREVIGNVWFAMPPKVVQVELIEQMEVELKPIDSAIAQERDQINLILEYRDRQIADVVTGQVDVRGWMPGPDVAVADEDLGVLGGDEELDTVGEEDNGDD